MIIITIIIIIQPDSIIYYQSAGTTDWRPVTGTEHETLKYAPNNKLQKIHKIETIIIIIIIQTLPIMLLSLSSSSSVGYTIHTQLSFPPHDESGSNVPTKPTNHLAIPVTYTLNYNWDSACANEFPVAVKGLDVGKMRTIAQEAICLMRGQNFAGRLSGIRTQIGHVYG